MGLIGAITGKIILDDISRRTKKRKKRRKPKEFDTAQSLLNTSVRKRFKRPKKLKEML